MDQLEELRDNVVHWEGAFEGLLVVIEEQALVRDLFLHGLRAVAPALRIEAFASVDGWVRRAKAAGEPLAIIYTVHGGTLTEPKNADALRRVERLTRPTPLIVHSESEEMSEIVAALELGASGFIPASLGLDAAVAAVRLALHGGIFLPMSSVLRLRDYSVPSAEAEGDGGFTSRQRAVAEALRRGKPNKLIAYELAMCESTVKVHVRKIMKKLEARNRTEASYKLNTLLTSQTAEFDEDLAS